MTRILHRRAVHRATNRVGLKVDPSRGFSRAAAVGRTLRNDTRGAALLEFAISLPLLVVFVVGIFDFSGAFNQKQKIAQAAQEGAIIAGAQTMSDIQSTNGNPDSLQPVLTAVFNSLAGTNVLPQPNQGSCTVASAAVSQAGPLGPLEWIYKISGCPDVLTVEINRGWLPAVGGAAQTVGTTVTVSYPYHWRFNSVIQLLFPGAPYAATTFLSETAKVHNQQ
jgi:Flp pilus assembly protein TadG